MIETEKKNVQLILGTMTFGESVFSPDVEMFINTFLDEGYEKVMTYGFAFCEKRCRVCQGKVFGGTGTG